MVIYYNIKINNLSTDLTYIHVNQQNMAELHNYYKFSGKKNPIQGQENTCVSPNITYPNVFNYHFWTNTDDGLVWFMVFNTTLRQYFSYIVAVSFIGGGNQNTWRKPPTCHKSLTNFITETLLKSDPCPV